MQNNLEDHTKKYKAIRAEIVTQEQQEGESFPSSTTQQVTSTQRAQPLEASQGIEFKPIHGQSGVTSNDGEFEPILGQSGVAPNDGSAFFVPLPGFTGDQSSSPPESSHSKATSLSGSVTETSSLTPSSSSSLTPSGPLIPPTNSTASTKSSPTVPIGALIGAILGTAVVLGAALFIILRRRRIAQPARSMTSTGNDVAYTSLLSPQTVPEPYMFSTTDAVRENKASAKVVPAMQQHSEIAEGDQRNSAAATPSIPQRGIDLVSAQRRNTGRRAVDAGPVADDVEDEDDTESTLPPEYRDVFNISRSPTVLSRKS